MNKMRYADGGAVRALRHVEGDKRRLEVLAAPFGSPQRLDRLKQFLSARTDFMIGVGDRRPTLYMHGYSPRKRQMAHPAPLGVAEASRIDSEGVWMIAEIDDSELSDRIWDAALEGKARASTGSVNYLVRPPDRKDGTSPPGEVMVWPIAELSLFDAGDDRVPVSDDAVVLPLRALFDELELELPKAFEAGEAEGATDDETPLPIRSTQTGEFTMDPEQKKAIDEAVDAALAAERADLLKVKEDTAKMRASIIKEFGIEVDDAGEPKHRATFNINRISDTVLLDEEAEKRGATIEQLEENFAYTRALIEAGKIVAEGGTPPAMFRAALEETVAAELQSMVPTDVAKQIKTLRGKYSLVRKAGMTIMQTDKLIFSVPAEVTAVTEAATIAEEGAYTDLQPVFGAKTATMLKKGGFIAVTEEGLEDQDLFQAYLIKASGKSLALAENAVLEALLFAVDGVELAATHTLTDGEILAGYFALAQEYRDEAVWIMNDITMGTIRSLLVATPRAYGDLGFGLGQMGEPGDTLMNHKVYTNSLWNPITTAGDDEKVIDFVNLDECLTWVERRALTIFVDPYSLRLSAGTINYLISARFNGVVTNSAALSGIDDHA